MLMLSVLLMMGVVFTSCKKESVHYPATITSGIWSGGNGSTGYTCDVTFSAEMQKPGDTFCVIVLAGPDKAKAGVFQGPFIYDPAVGVVTVQLGGEPGAPLSATLQFNTSGDALMVNFTSVVDFGTYIVHQNLYPQSIAGNWQAIAVGTTVKANLSWMVSEKGLACSVEVMQGAEVYEASGIYTYDAKIGKGIMELEEAVAGTLVYDIKDGKLSLSIPSENVNIKLSRTK